MKRFGVLLLAAVLLAAFIGCDDDGVKPPPPASPYKSLSENWHVLYNLELAYDKRNVSEIGKLLDTGFEFSFWPADVGGEIPPKWGRAEEMQATTNMFTGQPGSRSNPILSIDLTLFDLKNAVWVEINDDPDYPGETLQRTQVVYDYYMDTQLDVQFITAGAPKAEITIRNVDGKWKIVRWSDLPGAGLARTSAGTEESDWGQVKALYK